VQKIVPRTPIIGGVIGIEVFTLDIVRNGRKRNGLITFTNDAGLAMAKRACERSHRLSSGRADKVIVCLCREMYRHKKRMV